MYSYLPYLVPYINMIIPASQEQHYFAMYSTVIMIMDEADRFIYEVTIRYGSQ